MKKKNTVRRIGRPKKKITPHKKQNHTKKKHHHKNTMKNDSHPKHRLSFFVKEKTRELILDFLKMTQENLGVTHNNSL